jgi:hypothetical protein
MMDERPALGLDEAIAKDDRFLLHSLAPGGKTADVSKSLWLPGTLFIPVRLEDLPELIWTCCFSTERKRL